MVQIKLSVAFVLAAAAIAPALAAPVVTDQKTSVYIYDLTDDYLCLIE